jgi:hypothetical protein
LRSRQSQEKWQRAHDWIAGIKRELGIKEAVFTSDLPILRNSEVGEHERCKQRWYWSYVEGRRSRRVPTALWLGQGVHLALAEYYKYKGTRRGPHPAETFAEWAKGEKKNVYLVDDEDMCDKVDAVELGLLMLNGYVEHWGKETWKHVLAREQTSRLTIPNPKTGKPIVLSVGTFDLAYKDLRYSIPTNWLEEHKTTADTVISHLSLNPQASTYWLHASMSLRALELIGPDELLAGIMFNFLRKGKPDEREKDEKGRALNKDGSISKVQPKPLFFRHPVHRTAAHRNETARRLAFQSWEIEKRRKGELPIHKNATKDCAWDCSFHGICELHEAGQDWEEVAKYEFTRGDPYEDYRKSAAE